MYHHLMGRVISTDKYLCNTAGMHVLHAPPSEDIETSKKISMGRFGITFHTTKCYIWAKSDEKAFQHDPSKSFSTSQYLRLVAINITV